MNSSIYNAVRRQLDSQRLSTAALKRLAKSLYEDESDSAFVLYSAAIDLLDQRLTFQAFHRFQKSLEVSAKHLHIFRTFLAG